MVWLKHESLCCGLLTQRGQHHKEGTSKRAPGVPCLAACVWHINLHLLSG